MKQPSLVEYYIEGTQKVYNARTFVKPDKYPLFSVFTDDLREKGYGPKEYTDTVLPLLKGWVKYRKLRCVPQSVFCGNFALNKFISYMGRDYVYVDIAKESKKTDDEFVFSELIVARLYIAEHVKGNSIRLRDAVEFLKPMLSSDWLEAYKHGKDRPILKAMEILTDEYRAPYANDYNAIVRTILCRGQ